MEVGVGAMNKIILGDALQVLKDLPSDSIDLVCTDPPYGYSFMGKDWDKAVPSVEIWQECLRVLKPGAFCFVMSAPRSDVQMHMVQNLTEAGFRLDFTPIYWTYASGFPKAGNIGKMVDKKARRDYVQAAINLGLEIPGRSLDDWTKEEHAPGDKWWNEFKKVLDEKTWQSLEREVRGIQYKRTKQNWMPTSKDNNTYITNPRSPGAKALDGSYAGFQPKPAVEVIIVAMKPLSEKTFVDQALKNRKGITWLDDVRTPTGELKEQKAKGSNGGEAYGDYNLDAMYTPSNQGRFPANLLVSDDVLNDGKESKGFSGGGTKGAGYRNGYVGGEKHNKTLPAQTFNDSGSYSRYFDLDKWYKTLPFIITPKASKSEKNRGLNHLPKKEKINRNTFKSAEWNIDPRHPDGGYAVKHDTKMSNFHPTVKPLKLMSYLITLGSREKDIVLDPFVGSGTTCIAAKQLGRKYIGIEREAEYVEIAEARLKHTEKFKELKQVSLL